ncbi:PREDICTED: uncharacterized protein LOC109587247 [Amphimedon queenslandica]|uniref:Death domain-containing protein n=1 Tax=Amphimedon queenslandica TaxID=400682 RepID=A0AAN0JPU1_AMPQE|nr:PREDICTED: uncharacterized protein LOC109587247 [Amphimedon queenslandica]|eukprot:XP_019859046.1 PREDICTED: uncharacterized protein LOC109587247 [Amphimedon queenslandica]
MLQTIFCLLDTSNLIDVLDVLDDHEYSGVSYYKLGLRLGLLPGTLDVIEKNNKGDVRSCLRECLTAWLEQRDSVMRRGGSTYDTLIKALRRMGENAIADGVERDLRIRGDIVPPTADPISTEDTPAADRIPDTQNPLTEDAVNEWLKSTVELTVKRVQMHGLPGSGKTCSQHLLLNKEPPEENSSTPIACRAVKATRISSHDDRMEIVDAEALLSRLANDLKEAATKQKDPPPEDPPPEDHDAKSKEYSSKTNPTGSPKDTKATKPANTAETKGPANDTEANKIINEIVEAIPNAEGKFDSNWVYFIDSGGQTAFQELLPLFTRASSFNIITIDLSKGINEKLEQNYRIKGASLSQVENSKFLYTNIKFLNDVLYFGAILQPYHPPGSEENTSPGPATPQYPQYFVLGTHKDEAKQEVIKQYNKELSSLTSGSEKKGYRIIPAVRNGDIIYAVNTTLKPGPEREAEAKRLCKIIRKKVSGEKIPIPVRWFAFELTLLEKAKSCSFLQLDDVLRAGNSLKMTDDQTKEALQYLHNVTIILYYPQVLPDVVFVDPHPILDILSRLLALVTYQIPQEHLDHFVKEGVDLSESEETNLTKNGLFTQALLEKLKDDEDFPKADFIKLLLYLHIIIETDKPSEYFIPSALPSYPKTDKPLKSDIIDPLQIIWRSPVMEQEQDPCVILPVPFGIFPLAIVNLMKRTEQPKFHFPNTSSQCLRYRDAMSFRVYHQKNYIGTVHIIKKHECIEHRQIEDVQVEHRHIEIYFEGDAWKYCSLIREAVKEAISSSSKAINIKPDGYEFAFACPSIEGCYRIVTNVHEKKVQCTLCTKPPTISGGEKYWSWFDLKSLAEGTDASSAQPHQDSTTVNPDSDEVGQLGITDLNMVQTVLKEAQFGPVNWNNLGLKLGLYQPKLNVIGEGGGDADNHLRKTLEAWLEGKDNATSRTWKTLIDAVRETDGHAAADEIPKKTEIPL